VIGDFCIVESDVSLGPGNRLEPYVYIKRWTTMGRDNVISAHTVLGTDPLDKAFTGERSYLVIGDDNVIREHYTVSRGTKPESTTRIGDGNYIMTSGHIAHNCTIGNQTVIASCALVAGYVEVEDRAFLSGGVVIHQYSKVGRFAMIGGNCRVNLDAPPFFLYHGFDLEPVGLNVVGLRRGGVSREAIQAIKRAYRILYRSGKLLQDALKEIEAEAARGEAGSEELRQLVDFVRSSKRGITRPRARRVGGAQAPDDESGT
jgi:UDP-N-acetylglucosamine acyltransferase